MIYEITIAQSDVEAFRDAYYELYPGGHFISSRQLLFVRKFEVELTEEDYVFLSLKFKFVKPIMTIVKPQITYTKLILYKVFYIWIE